MAPIKIFLKKNELAKIKTLTKKGLEDDRVVKRAQILKSRHIEVGDREKENIVAMICSNPPDGYARWTINLIAEESVKRGRVESISKEKIQVVLQEHELKPWREKM